MSHLSRRKRFWLVFLLALAVFLTWRFTRRLNIFAVDDKFAVAFPVEIPDGLGGIRAEDCGFCHEEIYAEWKTSIHAQAWTDPYFQVDRAFEDNPPVCDNCHLQLQPQRDYLVAGFRDRGRLDPIKKPNPGFDPELRDEGVTCAVCHLREGKIVGPFETDLAPHPVEVDPGFLSGMSPCHICHVVSGDRWDTFFRYPPCGTVAEIEEGGKEPDCVGCHLPAVIRPVVEGGEPRPGGRHEFRGGHSPDMVRSALKVRYWRRDDGAKSTFTFELTNVGAYHHLPTGTPDRHLTLEMRLLDGSGREVDRKAFKMIRRVLWRPFIVDLWDTRLPHQKPREYSWSFSRSRRPGATVLDVTVRYHLLEESRRRRIGYENETPIAYPIYHQRIDLKAPGHRHLPAAPAGGRAGP
jgi:hypothetical protein